MRYFTAAIAMASGWVVLAGYFYPLDVLLQARAILTDWAVVIAAVAVLAGIFNMIITQMDRIRSRQKNAVYGVAMIVSLLATLTMAVLSRMFGFNDLFARIAIDAVIVPVEAALMAILAVTLVYASIRLLRRRADVMAVIFLVVALLTLLAILPLPLASADAANLAAYIQDSILQFVTLFSSGGARGLLIGVALGTLFTSLRVLFGADRPYGGN